MHHIHVHDVLSIVISFSIIIIPLFIFIFSNFFHLLYLFIFGCCLRTQNSQLFHCCLSVLLLLLSCIKKKLLIKWQECAETHSLTQTTITISVNKFSNIAYLATTLSWDYYFVNKRISLGYLDPKQNIFIYLSKRVKSGVHDINKTQLGKITIKP